MNELSNSQDAYRYDELRAKESWESYQGMRNLEWQTLLQTYAGYTAIALAFQQVILVLNDTLVQWAAITAALSVWLAMHYLHYRIEERLIVFYQRYRECMVHIRLQGTGEGSIEEENRELGHRFFWTYDTQFAMSTLTAVGVILYVRFRSFIATDAPDVTACAAIACVLLEWVVGRMALDQLVRGWDKKLSSLEADSKDKNTDVDLSNRKQQHAARGFND